MTASAVSRSANPPRGFAPLDPRLQRGTPLKASASPPHIREKPVKPAPIHRDSRQRSSEPIATRAELAECTCPEHCERDHDDE
jgi:hypothetical protein